MSTDLPPQPPESNPEETRPQNPAVSPAKGTAPSVPAKAAGVDDSGTQALAEALGSSFLFIKIIIIALVAGLVLSCFRSVESNEVAIILRFGEPVKAADGKVVRSPGFHWAFPYPIDEVVRIPVAGTQVIESTNGWYGISATMQIKGEESLPPESQSLVPGRDGYTLTGDGNIIHVKAKMNYTITDPERYAFNFVAATNVLQNILDNALIYASARFTANDAIYKDKAAFAETVQDRVVNKVMDEANGGANQVGIKVDLINVETQVPLSVRSSFNSVQESVEDRNRKISEARGYADEMTRKALGEAQAAISMGMTLSNQLVQALSGEAKSFVDQLPRYRDNPDLFEQRLRAETMGNLLTNAVEKFYLPNRADGQPRELRLQLNREPEKPKANR